MHRVAKSSLISIVSLVSALLLALGFAGNGFASAAGTVTLTGTYELVTADTLPSAHVGSKDVVQEYLVVGSTTYNLHWSHAKHLPKHLRGYSRITATGTLNGRDFTVSSVSAVTTLPLPATTGTTRVLVILAYWTAPDSVTQASAARSLFTDTNNWYRSTSYGLLGQSGDVTPWLPIAAPANNACYGERDAIMSNAQSAALSAGYDASTYDRTIVYFPNDSSAGSDCSNSAGWAPEPGNRVWLNGYIDLRVTTHEQGHNYGLSHAHSDLCSTGVLSGTCSFSDYGDDYDAMGSSGFVAQFSAKQKSQLGWLGATTLSAGTSTTLVPYEATSGTRSAVITVSSTRAYWLEFRQPIGVDSVLPNGATNGVLVHVVDPSVAPNDPYGAIGPALLDESPGDGTTAGNIGDATLKSGQQWTTPEGLTITVRSVTSAGAAVSVSSASTGQPDLVVTSLTWSPSTPVTGNAVTFTATIKNQGTSATPAGVKHGVAFLVDGTEVNWSDTDTASLAPGASITLTANGGPAGKSTWSATGGSHTVQAYVDDSKLIAESIETNNTLSKSLTVGSTLPDLIVTALSWSPTSPAPGSAVLFTATIKNQGTTATPGGVIHGVGFLVDGTNVSFSNTDTASLSAGASITLTANSSNAGPATWPATRGTHTVKAWVDDRNRIPESNESNNTLSKTLNVYASLAPSSVAISAGTLRAGTVTSLAKADGAYYQVNSTTATTRTTTWSATVANVPNVTAGLQLTYKGSDSVSATQVIYLFNYTTNAWVAVKTSTVGTTAATLIIVPTGTMADYVSGTTGSGSVKVQVKTTNTSASFYTSADQLNVGYL